MHQKELLENADIFSRYLVVNPDLSADLSEVGKLSRLVGKRLEQPRSTPSIAQAPLRSRRPNDSEKHPRARWCDNEVDCEPGSVAKNEQDAVDVWHLPVNNSRCDCLAGSGWNGRSRGEVGHDRVTMDL